MATFAGPTVEGNSVMGPPGHPLNPLLRFYGGWAQSVTVWKDSLGVWHQSTAPYLGGAVDVVHDWDHSTYTTPDEGLATAQKVYLGGHVHTISEADANELAAAGFGASILTRQSISESFNKADGALGPDLSWTRQVFTHQFPYSVVSNQVRMFSDVAGTYEDIQLPYPNVDSPNASMSLTVTNIAKTGSGDYVADIGGVLRHEPRTGNTNYRGYVAGIGRNNIFIPAADTWHLAIFRVDGTAPATLLAIALLSFADVTLPGTFTFTANGPNLTATFTHGGPGGTMSVNATDSTYTDGAVALGGSTVVSAGMTATVDADNFQAGPP